MNNPYIERKGVSTQNAMQVCDFNMCFTFVMVGWEVSAHDIRIFLDAILDPKYKFPHPPNDFMESENINRAYENIIDIEDVHDGESDDNDGGESNNSSGFEMELTRYAITSSLMNSLKL
ncbi:hypothetical protein J1N35_005106 [Gossypium stocksii]|uniref:Uncharacterized protein n=1 Tax=Gossypium stocksii TaxID=47602 RepID=A0A9D3WD76_9ROSI|nr:hypothetical protein J1N35_005106 [Gossypium stocksii]